MSNPGTCLIFLVKAHPQLLIDEEDLQKFGLMTGRLLKGYVELYRGHSSVALHRLILGEPSGHVDHINGNSLDNRKSNLRVCSHTENMYNRGVQSNNVLGYKGVGKQAAGKGYTARITAGGKCKCLGTFKTAELAAEAYNEAALKLHGPFAKLNRIKGPA